LKWYVCIETQKDGKDYVGICEYYGGEESQEGFVSLHDSEEEADAACIKYAQEQGLPLFADYREVKGMKEIIAKLTEVYRRYREENHSDYDREVAVKYGVMDILNTYKGLDEKDIIECLKIEIEDYEKHLKILPTEKPQPASRS